MSRAKASVENAKQAGEWIRDVTKGPVDRFLAVVNDAFEKEMAPVLGAIGKEYQEGDAVAGLPDELKLWHIANVLNKVWRGLRANFQRGIKNKALIGAIGEEVLGEMRLVSKVAIAGANKMKSDVDWTPPAKDEAAKQASTAIVVAQSQAVVAWQKKDAARSNMFR